MENEKQVPEALKAWRYITPLDMLILNKLKEGGSPSTLFEAINDKLGTNYSRGEIQKRIEELRKNGILKEYGTAIVDISKLYNHTMLTAVKFAFPPISRREAAVMSWSESWKKVRKIMEDEFKELSLLMMFTPEGEGEYDLYMVICTNSEDRYADFQNELLREELIEKSKTQRVLSPHGFHFSPSIMPSYEEFRDASELYKERLKSFSGERSRIEETPQ